MSGMGNVDANVLVTLAVAFIAGGGLVSAVQSIAHRRRTKAETADLITASAERIIERLEAIIQRLEIEKRALERERDGHVRELGELRHEIGLLRDEVARLQTVIVDMKRGAL